MRRIRWCVDISGKPHQILGLGLHANEPDQYDSGFCEGFFVTYEGFVHFHDVDWNETLKLNEMLELKENTTR